MNKNEDPDAIVDVQIDQRTHAYKGFFGIDVHRFRFRRFDGTMSEPITREIFERGTAVCVLPYDPQSDEVLLIRQFLPGAAVAGVPPRPLQVIAGMVEDGEKDDDVARREAMEEAGVRLDGLELVQRFLPSPGGSSERIAAYFAYADLSHAGGIHGLATENEDIRVEVMTGAKAVAMLDDGLIEAAPAVVLLQWFARHHDRLRFEGLAAASNP